MHRTDFQQLADVRIAEAKLLLDNGMYDGAYGVLQWIKVRW